MTKPRKTQPIASGVSRVTDAIRYAPNPIPQLTPQNLAAYLDSFTRGYLRDTAMLWHAIQWRDDRVASDCAKRHKATPRYGYKVVPADGVDAKSAAVKRQLDAVKFALENLSARDAMDSSVRGGISMLARQMMHAVGYQYQVHELVWQPRPEGLTLQTIAMPLWWFERTSGDLRYLPTDLALYGEPLEADGWMVTRGDGLMAPTSLLYLLKRMALTDWTLYNGRVGPGIQGKTNAPVGSKEWLGLEEAVDAFSFDLKMVTGDGVTIEPIEMALKGTLPWPEMYAAMVKAITVLWRGGNLMTDSAGGPDQRGVSLQGSEAITLEQDDAEILSETLNEYIVPAVIRYRFNEEPLVWVEWQTSAKPDLTSAISVDDALARRGWVFTQEDLAERYNRTAPQSGQTIMTPPQSSLTAGGLQADAREITAANSMVNYRFTGRITEKNRMNHLQSVGHIALVKAVAHDLEPLKKRLEAALALTDDKALLDALMAINTELPDLLKEICADPQAAQVLQESISASMLEGIAQGAAKYRRVSNAN